MELIGTPGLIKFFWPKDNVQTRYTDIYNIPVMDINKKLFNFSQKSDQEMILVHMKDTKSDMESIKIIQEKAKVKVYIVPDQNCPQNFEQIRKVYPDALGKMIFNGPDAHPLSKFLKRNSHRLYDFQMFGAKKSIPLDIFHKKGQKITHYSSQNLNEFIKKLNS